MRANEIVAFNLRKRRVELGLSQEALAGEADVDRTYIGRMERNLENPTVGMLERIADALRISVYDLLIPPAKGSKAPAPLKGGRKPA